MARGRKNRNQTGRQGFDSLPRPTRQTRIATPPQRAAAKDPAKPTIEFHRRLKMFHNPHYVNQDRPIALQRTA